MISTTELEHHKGKRIKMIAKTTYAHESSSFKYVLIFVALKVF